MNRLAFIAALVLILITPLAWGATTAQYPNPYRQTMWNNVTDSVHTVGQSPEEKRLTIRKLHAKRTNARLKSITAANLAKRKARRQAWLNRSN